MIATCGALPDPAIPGEPSVYEWLQRRLPVRFHHVLIDIPRDTHVDRIRQRGRSHLESKILTHNAK